MSVDVSEIHDDSRLRCWLGIFYPESSKPNWKHILESYMIPCAVSPLHDKDRFGDHLDDDLNLPDPDNGKLKKPHYHIVFKFDGPKSFHQVWDILKLITLDPKHCPPPQRPYSDVTRTVQYLVHANQPNKVPYPRSDIFSIGLDIDRYFRLTSEQEQICISFLIDFILDRNIFEYWDILLILKAESNNNQEYEDAYRYACKHTIFMKAIIDSRRNKEKDKEKYANTKQLYEMGKNLEERDKNYNI